MSVLKFTNDYLGRLIPDDEDFKINLVAELLLNNINKFTQDPD